MLRIIDDRDKGKTRALLEECSKTGGIFICKHPNRVLDKCYSYGIDSSNILPLGYDEALKCLKKEMNKKVYIDEIEEFISLLFENNTIMGYSLSKD